MLNQHEACTALAFEHGSVTIGPTQCVTHAAMIARCRYVDISSVRDILQQRRTNRRRSFTPRMLQDKCVDELSQLIQEDGYKAVRFNPYLWPEGQNMTNERGRAMYKRCAAVAMRRCNSAGWLALSVWPTQRMLSAPMWLAGQASWARQWGTCRSRASCCM